MSLTAIPNQPIGFATSYVQGCLCAQPDDIMFVQDGDNLLFQFNQETCNEEGLLPHPEFTDPSAWTNWDINDGSACWDTTLPATMTETTFTPTVGLLYYLTVQVSEYVGTSAVTWACGGANGTITGVGTFAFSFTATFTNALIFGAVTGMKEVCFSEVQIYEQSTDVAVDIIDTSDGSTVESFNYAGDPDYFTYNGPWLTIEIPVDVGWPECFFIQVTEECTRNALSSQTIKIVPDDGCTLVVRACNSGAAMGFSSGFQPVQRIKGKVTRPTYAYEENVERSTDGTVNNYYAERTRNLEFRLDWMGEKSHEFLSSLPLWDHVYVDDIEYHVKGEGYEPGYGDVWETHGGVILNVEPKVDPLRKVRCGPDVGCDPLIPEPIPPVGSPDPDFNVGGLNASVYEMRILTTRKIVVAGDFTAFGATTTNRLTRLNVDGSLDTTYNSALGSGFDATVQCIEQVLGRVYVGGNFTDFNGSTVGHIVRLDVNGLEDTSFATGTGFNGTFVNDMLLLQTGSLLCIGDFTQYDGTAASKICCLATDGTIDATFDYGAGLNAYPNSLALNPDGSILIATNVGSTYKGNTVRIGAASIFKVLANGDFVSLLAPDFNGSINGITVQPDGKILVAGSFTDYDGTACSRFIRLNDDGTVDTAFLTNLGSGFSGIAQGSWIDEQGRITIGVVSSPITFDGLPSNQLVRLDSEGVRDFTFNNGVSGFNGFTYWTAIDPFDDSMVVGGNFTAVDAFTRNRVARLL